MGEIRFQYEPRDLNQVSCQFSLVLRTNIKDLRRAGRLMCHMQAQQIYVQHFLKYTGDSKGLNCCITGRYVPSAHVKISKYLSRYVRVSSKNQDQISP